jgi:RNA polymerase sigma factor (sigma-70 family)
MIGWNAEHRVYGLKRLGRATMIRAALLREGREAGLVYSLDSSVDVERNSFTVDATFAVQPAKLGMALRQYLEHERSQSESIPSNVTMQRDAQATIVEHLGAARHGLLGVNPLPAYDLPAPLPVRALLYINRIAQHGSSRRQNALGVRVRPWFAGQEQSAVPNFHQRDDIATLILGLYEYDGTPLVVAWDPASHPALKATTLTVEEDTLRRARLGNDVVSEPRYQLAMGHTEEVLAAPLERLDRLIEARLRVPPKQRMIEALGGSSSMQIHLNAHTWTMVVDERLFHIQWCGPLLRGNADPHILPFSVADRFVAPDPDAVPLYAGYDIEHDVAVLWRLAPGENMYPELEFSIPDSVIAQAARSGIATHVARIGRVRLTFRNAVAAMYEPNSMASALRHLASEQNHPEMWRSRSADIHERLFEHLNPRESFDWERTRIRPWPITVDLPTLGPQSIDVFAYPATVSERRPGVIGIAIRAAAPSVAGRPSFFVSDREPVLLGECGDDLYVLFDPRMRPIITNEPHVLITVPSDRFEAVRTRGIDRMTRLDRYGEFEETIVFSTGERLLEALDLRLRTLPKPNDKRIGERLNVSDPRALSEMAMRLQYALRIPERKALTGTREIPAEMIVIDSQPPGIRRAPVKAEISRALRRAHPLDRSDLLRLYSSGTDRVALLHAGLRAVLEPDEPPRWPAPEQFDVLWALMRAAADGGTVPEELIQTACTNSLQWLFVGPRAPLQLQRNGAPDSYEVRLRPTTASIGSAVVLPERALDLALNHSSLYTANRARSGIVWAFIKKLGPARVMPEGSADEVVLKFNGQRIWIYGLGNLLRRSADGQTDYVTPALSWVQLSKMHSNPNDHHILAAFDPGRGSYDWVFWSARPHLEHLYDRNYRLHVSADLPATATQEWRPLGENGEERVNIFRTGRSNNSMPKFLKRLVAELPQDRLAALEAQASESGLAFEQIVAVMRPADQIAISMRLGLAPYRRRYRLAEITEATGIDIPRSAAFQHAIRLARVSLQAGDALPGLAEALALLRDSRAEEYVGSRILLRMLRELYGLPPAAKPASFAQVFGKLEISGRVWHALYRDLVMRLIRGAHRNGVSTPAISGIAAADRADTPPVASPREANTGTMPPMQIEEYGDPALNDPPRVTPDAIAATIALPDSEHLATGYPSALAALEGEHGIAWPPDVALPVTLSRLPPDVELIMRAYLGIWPYAHRYTEEQIAEKFGIRTHARARVLVRGAADELLAHAESLTGIALPVIESRPTLERIAALLIERAAVLTHDELNAVLARHGLAHTAPLITEATRQGESIEFRPSAQYRRALIQLSGARVTQDEGDDDPYWEPEVVDEVYRRIDAGQYADILLALRNPATRDETFSDMVLRSVVSVESRTRHRASAVQGRKLNSMSKRDTTMEYEEAVTRTTGYDPNIETFSRRADNLDTVLARALTISDDEAEWLGRVVEDGKRAYEDFLAGNIRLAYSIAMRAGYSDDRPASSELLDDAIVGLQRAIHGYRPKMSFTFGTYAFPVMRSIVFRRSAIRHAQRLNVSINRAQEIMMTRATRIRLREQATARQERREPTLEEMARAVLAPLLHRRLAEQLKREPTPRQLRDGWRDSMPGFVRRMKENMELVDAYDSAERTISLDRNFRDGDDRNLYQVVAGSPQSATPLPEDALDKLALEGDLAAALARAGLNEREQIVLAHHFGMPGYTQLPMDDIAARQSIGKDAAQAAIDSAMEKIRKSPQALTLLLPYLRQ